jgi:hypothetical protein
VIETKQIVKERSNAMKRNKLITTVMVTLITVVVTATVKADQPQLVNYQGFLTDSLGQPISGSRGVTFNIYDTSVGGVALWSSGQVTVQVDSGFFSYLLGSGSSLPPALFEGANRWLGIRIHPDNEMTPRTRLTSVPYAYHTQMSDTSSFSLVGGGWEVDSGQVSLATGSEMVGIGTTSPEAMLHIEVGDKLVPVVAPFSVTSGSTTYFTVTTDGKVGIGTNSPTSKLHVKEGDIKIEKNDARLKFRSTNYDAGTLGLTFENNGEAVFQGDNQNDWEFRFQPYTSGLGNYDAKLMVYGKGYDYIELTHDGTDGYIRTDEGDLVLNPAGNVGIGTSTPRALTHIRSENLGVSAAALQGDKLVIEDADAVLGLYSSPAGNFGSALSLSEIAGNTLVDKWAIVRETTSGGSGLRFTYGTNKNQAVNPTLFSVKTNGRVKCAELELTGGADVAEPFEISDNQTLPPGALLVIDSQNPGKLTLSDSPYDTRVAGIVSGAGGVNPGIMLTQNDAFVGGQNIAISGRVYCLVDASFGSITPGDLLTTSPNPGHAMKAADRERSYGAVIGKAMTGLDNGQGLVLVLVNLQ